MLDQVAGFRRKTSIGGTAVALNVIVPPSSATRHGRRRGLL
jgi:hypothetical protein